MRVGAATRRVVVVLNAQAQPHERNGDELQADAINVAQALSAELGGSGGGVSAQVEQLGLLPLLIPTPNRRAGMGENRRR